MSVTVAAKLRKASALTAVSLVLAGGVFVNRAYGGGPGACDDHVPDAFFTIQPSNKAVGELNASLNGNVSVACDDPIVSYEWDFGDGSTASGATASHHYGVGTYHPSLTITDAAGLTDTYTPQAGVVVKANNQAPVLTPATASVLQGESVTIDMSANGSDPDGDDISHSYYLPQSENGGSSVNTDKGSVSRYSDAGIFTYRAQQTARGQDTFQVAIADGFGGIATTTVTVDIAAHVTAVADTATTVEDTDVVINVVANDQSYQNEPFEIYTTFYLSTTGGQVINVDKAAGTITFRPDQGFVGTAGFEYGIKSLVPNTWRVSSAPVSVEVTARPNHAPVANNDMATVNEDAITTINVLGNDSDEDGDALTPSIVAAPAHGTASFGQNGNLNYTPAANYFGTDSITYQIVDTEGAVSTATVLVTVNSVNDAPQANFTWTKLGSGNISFDASSSSDIDGAIVSYRWDFGDGANETNTTSSASHKYKGKNYRTVTLTVTDTSGAQTTYSTVVTP